MAIHLDDVTALPLRPGLENGNHDGTVKVFVTAAFAEHAAVRRELGLSQARLGQRLGVSRGMIAYYESCARNPTVEFVQKVAYLLHLRCPLRFGFAIGER